MPGNEPRVDMVAAPWLRGCVEHRWMWPVVRTHNKAQLLFQLFHQKNKPGGFFSAYGKNYSSSMKPSLK